MSPGGDLFRRELRLLAFILHLDYRPVLAITCDDLKRPHLDAFLHRLVTESLADQSLHIYKEQVMCKQFSETEMLHFCRSDGM